MSEETLGLGDQTSTFKSEKTFRFLEYSCGGNTSFRFPLNLIVFCFRKRIRRRGRALGELEEIEKALKDLGYSTEAIREIVRWYAPLNREMSMSGKEGYVEISERSDTRRGKQ